MTRRIFLDLDGTLIDPRPRLYRLFCDLAGEGVLTFEEYWRIKRGRMDQRTLLRRYLNYTDAQIAAFKADWMVKVEEPERLAEDRPFAGVSPLLAELSQRYPLVLVTARQHPERVEAQLAAFGWRSYFSQVLVTGQKQSKDALIRTHYTPIQTDLLIGDTGEDIEAGKALGVTTVAVASGVLSADILREYQPDHLLDSVVAVKDL